MRYTKVLFGLAAALALTAPAANAQYVLVVDGDTFVGQVQGSVFYPCKARKIDLSAYPTLRPVASRQRCPQGARIAGELASDEGDNAAMQEEERREKEAVANENTRLEAALARERAKHKHN